MTKLLYTKFAENLKDNPAFPIAWLVFGILMVVAMGLGVEDYTTSYLGYASFPTQKAIPQVIYLVAALPQLVQMGAIYITIGLSKTDQKDRTFYGFDVLMLSSIIWAVAFLLDGYWDYIYKSGPYSAGGIYWQGLLDSYGVYGLLRIVTGKH